jgi:two-component system copper resistance phosphate regulon response regulator CusR
MRVLVVEDSDRLQRALVAGLRQHGFAVDAAADGRTGLERATRGSYDALVLDLWLPQLDGLDVLRRIRERRDDLPVLVLTARDAVADRVRGLDAGADDYLVKPFAFAELVARVRTLCRRRYGRRARMLEIADLAVDLSARLARRAGDLLDLTRGEFALLELLALHAGAVVSRREIEGSLYEEQRGPSSNVVDAAVCRLRRKVDRPGLEPLVHTHRGEGYRLGREAVR